MGTGRFRRDLIFFSCCWVIDGESAYTNSNRMCRFNDRYFSAFPARQGNRVVLERALQWYRQAAVHPEACRLRMMVAW
jgi:hypothetical protein